MTQRGAESLVWMPFFAMVLDRGTSLRGVEVLGPGARIEVGDGMGAHPGPPALVWYGTGRTRWSRPVG